jgi:hypothetical protein
MIKGDKRNLRKKSANRISGNRKILTKVKSSEIKMFKRAVLAFYDSDKISKKIKLKEQRLILAHDFRSFSPWLADFTG